MQKLFAYLTCCAMFAAVLCLLIYILASRSNTKKSIADTEMSIRSQPGKPASGTPIASLTPKDFEDIPDSICDALILLYKSTTYPPGSGFVLESLTSEEYRKSLRSQQINIKDGFVYIDSWRLEIENGVVIGQYTLRDYELTFSGYTLYKGAKRTIAFYPPHGTRSYRK